MPWHDVDDEWLEQAYRDYSRQELRDLYQESVQFRHWDDCDLIALELERRNKARKNVMLTTDILEDDDLDVVFIPVNRVGVMGAGLAKQFREKHFHLCGDYVVACHINNMANGSVYKIDAKTGTEYVFFPTKNHWRNGSKLNSITKELQRVFTEKHEDWRGCHVGIPLLGCGLGEINPDVAVPEFKRIVGEFPHVFVTFYDKR